MPGRKSNVSVATTAGPAPEEAQESTPARAPKEAKSDGIGVEDISLPKSMIARLAKGVLPPNTQIQKDALLALHKSATVFVSYVASNANESAQAAGKKTIAPHDVFAALKDAELDAFIPRLEEELSKYSSTQNSKRNTYRKKVKEEKAAAVNPDGENAEDGSLVDETNGRDEGDVVKSSSNLGPSATAEATTSANRQDDGRPFKKFKARDGGAIDPDADVDENVDDSDGEQEVYEHEEDDAQDDHDEDVDDEGEDGEENEDEADDDDDDDNDETMGNGIDELEAQAGIRDQALDEPDSD